MVKVRREREDAAPVLFELHDGEAFDAIKADMVVDQVGIARVVKPYDELKPGERIRIYDYEGEGDYGVWVHGRMTTYSCFWDEKQSETSEAVLERPPEMTWWVRVRNSKGKTGWLGLRNIEHRCGIQFAEDIDMGLR